ncbi:hypothetical protein DJ528_07005, partial [Sulfolobus sp. B5]
SYLIQKCIESSYFPISSFLTGYQSDNDNIGTIPLEQRNPELQTQSIVQWFIASGNIEPITIQTTSKGAITPQADVAYVSNTPPEGGYIVWTGDAGLIVGSGIDIGSANNPPANNPPQSSHYYLAFTVQLANGTWVTILDPNGLPQVSEENGQPSSALTLAVGVYNAQTGQMAMYINGTLVSEAQISGITYLNASATAFFDVGSAYNATGPAPAPPPGPAQSTLTWLPGFSGDIADAGSKAYSFNGALGPTIVYDIPLTSTQVEQIYSYGEIPSPNNVVVLWSQNFAQEVYLDTQTGTTQPAYFTNPHNPPNNQLSSEAVEVYNLADLSNLNGFWGWAGAIPTAFAPFGDIVIWGGPSPVLFNPSLLVGKNINITFESQGILVPEKPGMYTFSANFTDFVPIAENNLPPSGYADEWALVYINGKLVFEGKLVNNQVYVEYSDNPEFVSNNLPEFSYFLNKPVNLTVVFTFNLDVGNNAAPAIFFGIMWLPPGAQWFEPIPITNLEPLLLS